MDRVVEEMIKEEGLEDEEKKMEDDSDGGSDAGEVVEKHEKCCIAKYNTIKVLYLIVTLRECRRVRFLERRDWKLFFADIKKCVSGSKIVHTKHVYHPDLDGKYTNA